MVLSPTLNLFYVVWLENLLFVSDHASILVEQAEQLETTSEIDFAKQSDSNQKESIQNTTIDEKDKPMKVSLSQILISFQYNLF
jgi:F0F1-type ATP synthase epsilon subunit